MSGVLDTMPADEKDSLLRSLLQQKEVQDLLETVNGKLVLKRSIDEYKADTEDSLSELLDESSTSDVEDSMTTEEQELLVLYQENSGRELFRLGPDIFTTKGKFKKEYARLAAAAEKPGK